VPGHEHRASGIPDQSVDQSIDAVQEKKIACSENYGKYMNAVGRQKPGFSGF
jgi:hypothetical protein